MGAFNWMTLSWVHVWCRRKFDYNINKNELDKCEIVISYLIKSEENSFVGEFQQRADELHIHVYFHDELFTSLPTDNGVTQDSLLHFLRIIHHALNCENHAFTWPQLHTSWRQSEHWLSKFWYCRHILWQRNKHITAQCYEEQEWTRMSNLHNLWYRESKMTTSALCSMLIKENRMCTLIPWIWCL